MRPIALAGLAALLVAMVTSADEPTAQSAVAAETSKSDDQRSRSEGLIAKQIRANPSRVRGRTSGSTPSRHQGRKHARQAGWCR